jgi:Domain of unknown function (DUF4082)/Bacterial Ig domain/Viral BACON domain
VEILQPASCLARPGSRNTPPVVVHADRISPLRGARTRSLRAVLYVLITIVCALITRPAQAQTFGCNPPLANDIVCENSKLGNPSSEWDVSGSGDLTIQGFATDISVNQGGTVFFKINTDASAYTINIYRLGYYGGNGARKIATISPSVPLPQSQPACKADSTTNLVDCGNWAVSASWQVPSNATSGIYIAHLVRNDTGGDSHVVFIVRSDSSHSAILYQTSDQSWQAYNGYGGNSLYGPNGAFDIANRGFKVSYNRPFLTRGFEFESMTWVFGAEFAMIQWLEQNGYDVTYFTGIDAARSGTLIKNHNVYVTAGHDEYWSGPQRANVEAARDTGVNLAFFSANEVFWKVRWENSVDGTNTSYRTMVCYKETLAGAKIDPADPPTWTGTWRDQAFSPPADGGRPENSLTGTIFAVNGLHADSIQVPAADGKMRFWRNTAVASLAPGQTYTFPTQTLGYEWDQDSDNGFRPAGAFQLSTATYVLTADYLLDAGTTYGAGTATHHLMMYRAPSGALVFGAGTVNWAWGLNNNHDDPFGAPQNPDPNMQQAMVNLLADMHTQPATLQSGLFLATSSADAVAPGSSISSPASGSNITTGQSATIVGTAQDSGGGVIAGVEVSLDSGTTWHPANGRASWIYSWMPSQLGTFTIKSRAVDDSGNLETPSAGVSVTVVPPDCPCTSWSSTVTPSQVDSGDPSSVELGVKFRSDFNGYITGIRFYKSAANTGTHIGNLWTSTGTLLASATFTNETGSGWQQINFNNPVAIASNTTYVASYFAPAGHYSATEGFFSTSGLDNPPLHLLKNGVDGPNGVYRYPGSAFPTSTFHSTNYWVDAVFMPSESMPGAPAALLTNPLNLSFTGGVGMANPPSQSVSMFNEGSGTVTWTAARNVPWLVLSANSGTLPYTMNVSVNTSGLSAGNYTGAITINATGNIPTTTITVSLSLTNILLSTNFATQGLQGWVPSPSGLLSGWSVINLGTQYAAQYNGGGNTQLFAGNSAWTDYTLTVPIKLSSMNNYPGGIRARVNPVTGASYMLWLYPALGQFILYRAPGWNISQGLVQIGAGSAAFDISQFHNVAMTFSGSQIQALYDGKTVITATDSTYSSGLIALEGDNQLITYGNIVVNGPQPNTGSLNPSPTSLNYSANWNGPNPTPQTVQLNSAGGSLAWTAVTNAPWLSVSPSSGLTSASLQVSVNSFSLSGGTYNGIVTILSLGAVNNIQQINVNLTVVVPPPAIVLSPGSMSFVAVIGQPAPPSQALGVVNAGQGSFSWTSSTDSSWLIASPGSGSTPGVTNVSVNVAGLSTGTYTGHVIVSANGIANSPQSIPVAVQVMAKDLNENFSNVAAGWIISPMGHANGWNVSSGVYSYSGLGLSQSCAGNGAWTDYIFDANIKLSNLSNWPGGVRARVNPATGAGYVIWLYPGSRLVILYKVGAWNINDPSLTQLAQAALNFDTAAAHDLKTIFKGNQISVYWDGQFLMSATDSTYTSGFVCLDADNQPISYSNVQVAGVQNPATLDTPSPASLTFATLPGVTPASKTVNISAGGAATTWAVTSNTTWLSASISPTLTPGVITVSANPAGFPQGVYNGSLSVFAPGATNSPVTIPVTLAVKSAILSVSPSSLTYFGAISLNPRSQNIQITNTGTGSLNWTASATSPWLGLSAASGLAPSTIAATPNTSGLAIGSYNNTITVSSPDVTNSPATLGVSLQVGSLLFSDNFSSGAGNWTVGPLGLASGWSVANGFYTYNGAGPTQSWAGNASWANYTVATDFRLASLNDYPGGLRGRLDPNTGASYGVWIYPGERVLKLFRIGQWNIDSGFALLGQSGQLSMDTNSHTLRLSFKGSTIQVYYDESLAITASDPTYAQGAIAFDVSNQPISFTNVTAISLP